MKWKPGVILMNLILRRARLISKRLLSNNKDPFVKDDKSSSDKNKTETKEKDNVANEANPDAFDFLNDKKFESYKCTVFLDQEYKKTENLLRAIAIEFCELPPDEWSDCPACETLLAFYGLTVDEFKKGKESITEKRNEFKKRIFKEILKRK